MCPVKRHCIPTNSMESALQLTSDLLGGKEIKNTIEGSIMCPLHYYFHQNSKQLALQGVCHCSTQKYLTCIVKIPLTCIFPALTLQILQTLVLVGEAEMQQQHIQHVKSVNFMSGYTGKGHTVIF